MRPNTLTTATILTNPPGSSTRLLHFSAPLLRQRAGSSPNCKTRSEWPVCTTQLCGVMAPDGYHYSLLMLRSWHRNTFGSASPSSHTPKYQAYSTALRALQWIFILYVAILCCTSDEVAQLLKFMTNLYTQLHIAVPWTCKHASMFVAVWKGVIFTNLINPKQAAISTYYELSL